MERDEPGRGVSEEARLGEGQQRARQPEPGKVTLTSKLSPGREPAVQRQAAPPGNEATPPPRSLADFAADPWMDAAHRGLTAVAQSDQAAVQASPAPGRAAAPAGPVAAPPTSRTESPETIDPPQPGIDRPGFIDNDDGANIRTGPAELDGVALTARPLPPATRVFVSGQHPEAPAWWYVTAFLPGAIVRGYVQDFRVNIDLPEPTARLYQIQPGDTAERLAVQEFSAAVRDGHDLRYYENILLDVNRDRNRAGIKGSFQDPGVLGGGANNIRLEAGRRIWLVSPAHARALEGKVPDGSLTGGLHARARRALGHIDDLVQSVTDLPRYFGSVAGEYADAIKEHLPEIIGITAGFILAESASAFLAATPTGAGQLAAVVIQLGLAAFGAKLAVDACGQAQQHGEQWLTLAWTAHGEPEQLAAGSREFLKMLVSIAMAALTIAGVRGNMGKGLKIADAIKIQPPTLGWSAMATADGAAVAGGPVFTPGSVTSAGAVDIGGPSLMSALSSGGGKAKTERIRSGESSPTAELGTERIYGCRCEYRWVTDQHGHRVKRYLVQNEDDLLHVADNAAGGSLSNFKEIKPNWYEGEIGGQRIKIEWQPGGERVMNEGPHVKVQRWDSKKGKGGKWLAPEKIFIEGKETLHGGY